MQHKQTGLQSAESFSASFSEASPDHTGTASNPTLHAPHATLHRPEGVKFRIVLIDSAAKLTELLIEPQPFGVCFFKFFPEGDFDLGKFFA